MRGKILPLFFLGVSIACAQSITVQNPGFETANLATNGDQCNLIAGSTIYPPAGTLPDWSGSSTTVAAGAGAQVSPLGYPGWTTKWWSGNNYGWLQINAPGTVALVQNLSAPLQNNMNYMLSALISRPLVTAPPGQARFNYSLQLWGGTTLLASASNLVGMPADTAATDSLNYFSGANNPLAGQPLSIVLSSTNVSGAVTLAFFDNISLTATTAATTVSAVISASGFGAFPSASPDSWIEIYGGSLATDTRSWTLADITGNTAPTSLDGTKVTIAGKSAFIDYISPGQVNALIPSDTPTGTQQLTVTSPAGSSTAYSITINPAQPGLLAPPNFKIGSIQYAVAIFTDGAFALPAGSVPSLNSRPAKPGDVVTVYGVGFGPVTPSIPAGQFAQQLTTLAMPLLVSIGGVPATLDYDGLSPSYTGLYQINMTVPSVPAGNAALTFTLGGTPGTQTLYLPIAN